MISFDPYAAFGISIHHHIDFKYCYLRHGDTVLYKGTIVDADKGNFEKAGAKTGSLMQISDEYNDDYKHIVSPKIPTGVWVQGQ
jgi:hypothetical protein